MHFDGGTLIPIIALSIPLVALIGKRIVEPLAEALMHSAGPGKEPADPDARRELEELRDRLDGLEKALSRVEEEQAFQRALQTGETFGAADDAPRIAGGSRRG
ncbi:MAG: hypothetical protein Q8W51_05265 [Candidatus Palauibacterales bacterium]|nr:hypothetical protein [Candidatus Palauibacterales bacterium]MDP2529126.1 hypothetical protein [Candidatus Palauibacterales bacterium]MDP2583927.1 hypothetical protein [Candidatus Palauibacterales bacterium]